jgi:hypothetical protein
VRAAIDLRGRLSGLRGLAQSGCARVGEMGIRRFRVAGPRVVAGSNVARRHSPPLQRVAVSSGMEASFVTQLRSGRSLDRALRYNVVILVS